MLHIYFGPMFSNKTGSLILALRRRKIAGARVRAIQHVTSEGESRDELLGSRDGVKWPDEETWRLSDLEEATRRLRDERVQVVGVDEVQFFPSHTPILRWVCEMGLSVYVAGLDATFERKPFGSWMQLLVPYAAHVQKLLAVCVRCGRDAECTHRKVNSVEEVLLGDADEYEPLCIRCHVACVPLAA